MTTKTYPTLYRRARGNQLRFWYMELDGDKYRSVSGVVDGTPVESGWTHATPKNEGKKNAKDAKQQALFEIDAEYTKKRNKGYFDDPEEVDNVPFTKPMLATDYTKRKDKLAKDADLYMQPKLDGIRCIAREDGLWTRAGKKIVSCPHVEEALAPLFDDNPELILDGELYNHELKEDFNTITSIVRKTKPKDADIEKAKELVQYHIYDVIDTEKMLSERLKWIVQTFKDFGDPIRLVPTKRCMDQTSLDTWYEKWLSEGYEGQMVRLESPYQIDKRSNDLMKRKEFITDEFKVVRVEEGVGNWRGAIKRFILELGDGSFFGSGVRGTKAEMTKLLKSGKTPDWATVRYFSPTPDGVPRFPVVIDYGYGERQD